MLKLKQLLHESGDLQKYVPNAVAANTFTDFLKSLVGQRLSSLLDAASYARLYVGNKYGIGPEHDKADPQVQLSNLMTATTDYINFRKLTPLRAKLDAADAEDKKKPEYQAYHKQRMELAKAIMLARRAGQDTSQLYAQQSALQDPSSYSKNMDDMQVLVKQFHGSPLSLQDVLPSGSDSEDDKKRFAHAEKAFNAFKAAS
jgi:hypothetical protein